MQVEGPVTILVL